MCLYQGGRVGDGLQISMAIEIEDFKIYELSREDQRPINEIKWFTGLKNSIELSGADFQEHAQFRDWCLENCNNKIVFVQEVNYDFNTVIYVYFYAEEDAVAAKLRWT